MEHFLERLGLALLLDLVSGFFFALTFQPLTAFSLTIAAFGCYLVLIFFSKPVYTAYCDFLERQQRNLVAQREHTYKTRELQHKDTVLSIEQGKLDVARMTAHLEAQIKHGQFQIERQRFAIEQTAGPVTILSTSEWLYMPVADRIIGPPRSGQVIEPPLITEPPPSPGPCRMMDIIRRIDLSADCVFLGLARSDRPITCTLEGLMHVAKDSPTGQGKTAISYAQMVMLLAMQTKIIIANPHFVGVDRKGRDWRPIGAAIEKQGWVDVAPGRKMLPLVRKPQHIETMLRWLATVEIDRRFALMDEGDFSFQPLYIFIDEWPYVVSVCPDAARYMKLVLQRGRAVDVCVDTNAQGFLVADVDLPGSARENFNTAYHMGGNPRSASMLLDMPVADLNKLLRREDTPPLGKGVALLRNNEACPNAELVRLPYADNEFAYYLLGRADHWRINPLPELETSMTEMEDESRQLVEEQQVATPTNAHFQNGNLEEMVKQAWNEGHTGVRKIERALGISYYQAQKICTKLGLID